MEKENNLFIIEISHLPYLYKKIIFIIFLKKKLNHQKLPISGLQKSTLV